MSEATPTPTPSLPHRRGQALAEFALTLPILLLLVFGIIEFARLFQTWVVLQSAARAGARAASVGAINYNIFNVPASAQPQDLRVLDGIVPCLDGDVRGTKVTDAGTSVQYYNGGEGLFATMYDGANCDPTNEDHLQLRKDILRIFTVIAAVRDASSTIAVYPDRVDQQYDSITASQAFDFFKGYWVRPYKNQVNSESPGWISIEICSSRPLLDGTPASSNASFGARFATVRNSSDAAAVGGPATLYNYPQPFCMLNEVPADGTSGPRPDALYNAGQRWFDVGGPGDRVSVFIKFNHPLITPLNLAQYVYLQSRRSSVNESFRAPKAVGAFQRSIPPGRDDDPEQESTWTPTESPVPPDTLTPSATYTRTPTETPDPFTCDNLHVVWSDNPFIGQELYMTIFNDNIQQTELSRVRLSWNSKPAYQSMFAQTFSLNGNTHWQGTAPGTPPQTLVDTRTDGTFYDGLSGRPGSYRFISSSATWTAFFANGPLNLSPTFNFLDFSAEFELTNPSGGAPCLIQLTAPDVPPPTITNTPTAGNSPSPTPVCGSLGNIQLQNTIAFDAFDGSVRFNLVNTGSWPIYLVGFQLVWPDPTHPDIGQAAGRYYLRRVMVGGSSASDPASVQVWTSTAVGQDAVGNTKTTIPYDIATTSLLPAEGTWNINAVLQPGNNYVYLDFDGFAGSITQFGVAPYHFHRPTFILGYPAGCGVGQGGPGPQPSATVQVNFPSPTTTNTPRNTSPPQPTLTASNTVPTATRTRTPTNLPTATASNTLPFTNTPSRTPLGYTPTQSGGGDGT